VPPLVISNEEIARAVEVINEAADTLGI